MSCAKLFTKTATETCNRKTRVAQAKNGLKVFTFVDVTGRQQRKRAGEWFPCKTQRPRRQWQWNFRKISEEEQDQLQPDSKGRGEDERTEEWGEQPTRPVEFVVHSGAAPDLARVSMSSQVSKCAIGFCLGEFNRGIYILQDPPGNPQVRHSPHHGRNWLRQDHANASVSVRSRLCEQGDDRRHATTSSCSHNRSKTCLTRDGLHTRRHCRFHRAFRGLHVQGHEDPLHNRRLPASRGYFRSIVEEL